jgi:sugar lactone lactonase YvrE
MNYASSGDGGYLGVYYGQNSLWYPAAQTYEISVGGTALYRANNARGWTESTWWAAGGGCSRSEVKPAWQLDTACPYRDDNDVTAVGAPETPVSVYYNGKWELWAGTSAASPLVAGIEAHASAFAHSLPGADAFYSDPAAFNDVTEGANAANGECEVAILCNAGPGWDAPTGMGSPNGPLTISSLPVLVATTPANSVSGTAATLNGLIDPQGNETSYRFEYGTSAFYGSSTTGASAGSGSARVPVSQALTGLSENTTYHYRLVASHGAETVYGQDSVFRTAAPTLNAVTPDVGPAAGGTQVTISGTNFAGVTAVKFGSRPARSFHVSSESSITATSPPGSGTVDVTVSTPSGTTATSSGDRFHYERVLWQKGELTPTEEGPWSLYLNGVSCASSVWCMAVGTHQSAGWPDPYRSGAQVWSGGKWTKSPASPGGEAANLSEPLGAAVDSRGNVWVTDSGHNRVEEFSPAGVFLMAFGSGVKDGKAEVETCTESCRSGVSGSGAGQFKTPWGIAFAPNGDLWVVDSENHRVEEFTPTGTYIRQITSSGMSEGPYPVKRLAIDKEGNLWVSEPGSGQVEEFKESGTPEPSHKIVSLNIPTGIAIDKEGNVWVAEEGNQRLDEYSSAAAFIRTTGWGVKDGKSEPETCTASCQPGIPGTGNGQFDAPKSVVIDEKGNVWVINSQWAPFGEELRLEGGEVKFVRGFHPEAPFEQGLALGNGSVYSVDGGGNRVDQWPIPGSDTEALVDRYMVPASMVLGGVSCNATTACMAVGAYHELVYVGGNQTYPYASLAEHWNGHEWEVQPVPSASGAKRSGLNGVSCVSATECVAVGASEESSGVSVPYAAVWRNGAWSAQAPPVPSEGGIHTYLSRVSCTSPKFCMAVGTRHEDRNEPAGTGYGRAFAEVWNGSEWKLASTPELTNWQSGLSGVSCTSPNMCLGVGQYYKSGFIDLVEKWNGKEWSQETAAPEGGEFQGGWAGVSCTTPESCTLVGNYELHHGGPWVDGVQTWNGRSWTNQTTAAASNAETSGLVDASCVGEAGCVAVGINGGFYSSERAETRGENTMALQATPMEAESSHGVLAGSSCVSSSTCIAVGSYDKKGTTTPVGMAEEWNGFSWSATAHAPVSPSGGTSIELQHVSCEPNGTGSGGAHATCTAVGSYKNSAGMTVTLAERWNGSEWQVQPTQNPAGATGAALSAVSCASASWCTADGSYKNSAGMTVTLAERWNGSEWQLQSTPNPANAKESQLTGVSCTSATSCSAVGFFRIGATSAADMSLAESWNGTEWKLQSSQNPSGATKVQLAGVSCTSASSCAAVGSYTNSAGNVTSLAESWSGSEWQVQALEGPEGATQSKLQGISCDVLGGCTAVGWSKGSTGNVQPAAELWNGFEWKPLPIPSPSNEGGELLDVSCLTVDACEAAGTYTNPAKVQVSLAEGLGAPGASTGQAKELSHFGATLTGSVEQNQWFTSYHFEYGETTAYGTSVPVANLGLFSESGVNEVSQAIAGLKQNTTYHFRLVATSEGGTTFGQDQTFTTVATPTPGATTGPATSVTWDTAVLAGTVTPNKWATTYDFEYGPTTAYGSKIPLPEANLKSETSAENVTEQITGLVPNKTYHYRLVANNSGNVTDGEDETFTTAAAGVTPTFTTAFGSPGSGNGQLSRPQGDAVDANGNVWVSDGANNRVEEFSASGEFKLVFGWGVKDRKAEAETCTSTETCQAGIAGTEPGQFNEPAGIAMEGSNLWVVDRGNGRVEEFSSAGAYLNKQIAIGAGYITGIAPDGRGDLFVTGASFGSLQKWSIATGKQVVNQVLTWFNGNYSPQNGVAVDQQGNVWVADESGNRVREYSNNLEFKRGFGWGVKDGKAEAETCTSESECELGIAGSGEGQFNKPGYLAFDTNGDLWVADPGNNRVEEFSPRAEYITQFGSAGSGAGQFSSPQGIAIANGFGYVVDSGNNRVQKWDLTAPVNTASFGSLGSANGQLSGPQGEAVDASGNVWVSDAANNRVDEFASSGEFKLAFGWGVKDGKAGPETCTGSETCRAGIAGSEPGQLSEPAGIATEGGNVWVVDRRNDRVEEFNSAGAYLNKQIATGSAQYPIFPNGVAPDGHGDLFVTGSNFGSLQKYSIATGGQVAPQVLTWFNGNYSPQYGVAVDQEGNVWVADGRGNRVREYSSNLEFKLGFGWGVKDGEAKLETCASESECKLGIAGSGEGQFNNPGNLGIDAAGNLWVADQGNNRVEELSPGGQYIMQFGSAGSGAGQFSNPQGIGVSGGSAYVVDNGNNRVEKWGVLE